MLLHDITDIVKDTGFKVFASVAQSGAVKAINVKVPATGPAARWRSSPASPRPTAPKGMAWVAFTTDGQEKSPIKKFFTDESGRP